MTSQKSDTHPNSLDSPFAKAVLLKQALPLTAGGLFTAMVSFATYGEALDQHWTTAWLLLTVGTVLFSYFGIIRLYKPLLWAIGLAILLIQGIRGGHSQWESLAFWAWLWTWIWTFPNTQSKAWPAIKALPLFGAVIGGLMLWLALKTMWNEGWSHGDSYQMTLPWAHRNIAVESIFLMCTLGGLMARKKWLLWWAFITVLALVYQVRGVLLGSLFWMLYELWQNHRAPRWVKRGFLTACALFCLAQVGWNLLPEETRYAQFSQSPDVLKSLDVVYNLNGAESSSIRLQLWSWTAGSIEPLGGGLGSWRNDAEGWVNVATGQCQEATRRAHSEFLQWIYELGWIPFLALAGLCWPLRRSMGRWVWLGLPFLAFTFPTERAEILWAMAVLGWWLKSQYPPKDSPNWSPASPRMQTALTSTWVAISLLVGSWVVAQNALGETMQQRGTLKTNWSPLQQNCLSLHPQDIALNHADVMRAMTAFNEGRMEEGKAIIKAHLEANPNSVTAIRVMLKLSQQNYKGEEFCGFLENWLLSPDLSSLEATP